MRVSASRGVLGCGQVSVSLRERALADAAVVPVDQIPMVARRLGFQLDWPELTLGSPDVGYVYLARAQRRVMKVGFSRDVRDRMRVLRLKPLALVCFAQRKHEAAIHRMLRTEHIVDRREYFSGVKTDAIVAELLRIGTTKYRETHAYDSPGALLQALQA